MVRHVVMWKLKDEAEGASKAENAVKMARMLEGLVGKIGGLLKLEVGIDSVGAEGAWDVVLVADFESEEALAAYQVHPLHKEVGKFVGAVRAQRAVVDYTVYGVGRRV